MTWPHLPRCFFLFIQAFEQTLKTRYECMVDALHEKVKAEQEARMQRAIDNLEVSCGNLLLLPQWRVLP
jgi:hypothetical protein